MGYIAVNKLALRAKRACSWSMTSGGCEFIDITELCAIVEPARKIDAIKEDPADNKILECAIEANADYIITYDKKHLLKLKKFEGVNIVSPADFLKILMNKSQTAGPI